MSTEKPDDFVPINRQSKFSSHVGPQFVPKDQPPATKLVKAGLTLEEHHTGGPGRGHGGVTMMFLDEVMGRAASEAVNAMCVTISMTTNFCQSTAIGDFITASAHVARHGKSIVFVDGQLHNSKGKLVATATGAWSNTGIPIPGREK